MSTTWFDGTITGYEAADIGPLFLRGTAGWFDPTYYGAVMDLRPIVATPVAGLAVFNYGSGRASNGDAGKRVLVRGAGPVVATASDGAMSLTPSPSANVLTSASASFDNSLLGRRVTITGAGAAGATLAAFVWGVVSPTQLQLTSNCSTTATSCTYVISDDLYANTLASSSTQLTIDANASTAGTNLTGWIGTDDTAAVNACIVAATAAEGALGVGPTVYLPRPFAVTSPLLVTGKMRMVGTGAAGFSQAFGPAGTVIRALAPEMNACIRVGVATVANLAASGMGVRGSITAGLKILTDPDASFVAGDVGRRISVVGAAAQLGSQTQTALTTTIASVDSATQVTLTAAAVTTVTEGVYSYTPSGVGGGFGLLSFERLHIMGSAGQKCGMHLIGASAYELKDVSFSDYRSGIGFYADPSWNTATEGNCADCMFNNCRVGAKNLSTLSGRTIVDGNDNQIAVVPGEGTIGLDTNSLYAPGTVIVQAYETCLSAEGRVNMSFLRMEGFTVGVHLRGDGALGNAGGSGNQIRVVSVSTSSGTGSSGQPLVMEAGVQNTVFEPGYYVLGYNDIYGHADATALLSTVAVDPNISTPQAPTYTASYTPNLALGKTIRMTLTGNITVNAPTNATAGLIVTFIFTQDGSGGRVVTWNATYKTSATSWPVVTTAGKINTISFSWSGANWVQIGHAVGI